MTRQDKARRSSLKAVRLHKFNEMPVVDDVPEPEITGALDVIVKIGGAGVCRTDLHIIEGQWDAAMGTPSALHPRPRERRVGARGRFRRHQRGGRRHGHPAPAGHLRAVPGVPGRRRHALREQRLPRPASRDGGMAEYLLTSARACVKLDPSTGRRTSRRWPTPASPPTTPCARRSRCCTRARPPWCIGAGGLGHIGIQCLSALTATRIIVVDRQPGRAQAGRADRRGPHAWSATAARSTRSRT